MTAHSVSPVMNDPPIAPMPWPKNTAPTTSSTRPRPPAIPRKTIG